MRRYCPANMSLPTEIKNETGDVCYTDLSSGLYRWNMNLDHSIGYVVNSGNGHTSVESHTDTAVGLDTGHMNSIPNSNIIHTGQGCNTPVLINTEQRAAENGIHHLLYVSGCDIELDISIKGLKLMETTSTTITYNATITLAKAFVLLGILGYKREELEDCILYPKGNDTITENNDVTVHRNPVEYGKNMNNASISSNDCVNINRNQDKQINTAPPTSNESTLPIVIPVPTGKTITEPPTVPDILDSAVCKVEPHESDDDFNMEESTDEEGECTSPSESVPAEVTTVQQSVTSEAVKKPHLGGLKPKFGRRHEIGECDMCGKRMLAKNINEHKRIHGEKTFLCPLCPMKFLYKKSVKHHVRTHSSKRTLRREADLAACKAEANNNGDESAEAVIPGRRRKTKLNPRARRDCEVCGRNVLVTRMTDHQRSVHGEKTFECSSCPYKSTNKSALVVHMRKHTRSNQDVKKDTDGSCEAKCDGGGTVIVSASTGQKDSQGDADADMKPDFQPPEVIKSICDICGKDVLNSSMSYHRQTHGEKVHQCPTCPMKFVMKGGLKTHMITHKVNKPHMCSECGKSFCTVSQLKIHAYLHTGEKPEICTYCGFTSRCVSNLKRHVQCMHINLKPYKCPYCPKAFNSPTSFKQHKRIHEGEKPFKCELCPFASCRSNGLAAHMKSHIRRSQIGQPMSDQQIKRISFT